MARPQMDGKRIHVMLTTPQLKYLALQAKKTGLTTSDLIRRCVDASIARDERAKAQ